MEICKFEDWIKLKMVIGEVIKKDSTIVKIDLGNETKEVKSLLDLREGQKIVVLMKKEGLIIPSIDGKAISPEKDIEVGSIVR